MEEGKTKVHSIDSWIWGTFGLCAVVALCQTYQLGARSKSTPSSPLFRQFERQYLAVFFLMMAGDWLQGPYVYALYDAYGFSRNEIAQLFTVGFLASMMLGTIAGSLADAYGRRAMGLVYAVVYITACLTKHINYWPCLVLGRVLSGISTSLLFSVFDAWLVGEHRRRGYDPALLPSVFSKAYGGNPCVAIVCGFLAQGASDYTPAWETGTFNAGGYTAPFDLATIFLGLGALLIVRHWPENYGDRSDNGSFRSRIMTGLRVLRTEPKVRNCGLMQCTFEGAMYCFVFMWTPSLHAHVETLPHGLIFATFMLACMVGSQFVAWHPLESTTVLFLLAAVSLAIAAVGIGPRATFSGFVVFEVCVGAYHPTISALKSEIVPEAHRATIYTLFRVPLNAIVLFVLLGNFSQANTLFMCATLLLGAASAGYMLHSHHHSHTD